MQTVPKGSKVYVTRRVPQAGVDLLRSAGCLLSQWESDAPVPRDQLRNGVRGCNALFCLLTDRIDKDIIDSAGLSLVLLVRVTVIHDCSIGYSPRVLRSGSPTETHA